MFDADWALLGIAPTGELLVIKRAYAARLRLTRPDDDAPAYQALREAYERAQQWARWAAIPAVEVELQSVPEPEPEAEAEPEPAVPSEPAVMAASVETLLDRAELGWRRGGEVGLMTDWPALRQALHELPLAEQARAAARFADLAIRLPQLPDAFLAGLAQHFAWLSDFRRARELGPERLQALQGLLHERLVPTLDDPEQLRLYAPLLTLKRLHLQSRPWAALGLALALGDPLAQLYRQAGVRTLRALGINGDLPRKLGNDFTLGLLLRCAALLALLALPLALTAANGPELVGRLFSCAALGFLGWGLVMVLGLGAWRSQAGQPWRTHRLLPWAGTVLLAAAAVLAAGVAEPALPLLPWLLWLMLAAPGVWLLLPHNAQHGLVATAALPLVWAVLYPWLADVPAQPIVALSLALAWLLLGCQADERGVWLVPGGAWLVRLFMPLVNSLRLSDRWGYCFALAPIGFCLALRLHQVVVQGGGLLVCWVAAVLALGLFQRALERAALSRVGCAPAG